MKNGKSEFTLPWFISATGVAMALVAIVVFVFVIVKEQIQKNRGTAIVTLSPVQKAIVAMTNEVTEIGWRFELDTEYEPVSGQSFVMFSVSGDTNDLTSIRKALKAVDQSGTDYSRRSFKDQLGFETYVVRLNYRGADNQWMTEYVTMRNARVLRAKK
jgi:hypothetical protein